MTLQLVVLRRGVENQRGENLLEDVAVALEEELEIFTDVVGDQIDLQAILVAGNFDGFRAGFQA